MVNIYKQDIIATYRERFKKSDNARIRKLNKDDIKVLLDELGEGLADILEAAPVHGFDGIHLGAGQIKLSVRPPQEVNDISTGKRITTAPTPLFYFKASAPLKKRLKETLLELQEEENGEEIGEGDL